MLKHKDAGDLKAGNTFGMAGNLFFISEVYETVDPDMVKIRFHQIGENPKPCTATLPRDLFFVTNS